MNGDHKDEHLLSPVKRALLKIEELQARLNAVQQAAREPIAIIGLACRFPGGSDSPEAFWQFLRKGQDAVREIPKDRWDIDQFYDATPGTPGKMYTRCGAFLDRVDRFDAQFFGIAPREAVGMDPQQRLLLEVTWEALERSAIAPDSLSGSRTGVFVGLCTSDYAGLQMRALDFTALDAYHASGIAHSIASGRLSYVLGLQGPCITLDTACSSSLVAIHLACQSLRSGECNMALAGGVSVIASPDMFIALSKASMLARDGRCKTFDASADGYSRGEGCGVVVLKRLSDAQAAGDNILALIRGTAVNQDGPSSGLTAPNGPSQVSVIRDALANAGVSPKDVSYVEAHGTGTSLGDPIEVQALAAAYNPNRPPDQPLLIGALKSNIGHLEGAAGVAGLIKLVLALQHREIPSSLHVKTPNPFIPWGELSVQITTKLTAWEPDSKSRIAGLSSFGFSGTNAHALLEEAPQPQQVRPEVERPLHLLALSATSEEALTALAASYCEYLGDEPSQAIADICYTANSGRAHWQHRMALVADSSAQISEQLAKVKAGATTPGVFKGIARTSEKVKVAFLFTGQGSQYVGMGRQLYETQPTFRKVLDQCSEILRNELDVPLLSVLYPETGKASSLDETRYTQPALFSIEYALAQLWLSWGIVPAVVLGHSVGEYVAACVAGVFSLEDGLKLIAARGRLMQQKCERGAMAAVAGDEARIEAEVRNYSRDVAIAALNGPGNTVISGRSDKVEELLARFAAQGLKTTRLAVSHAFHSPLMEPMLEEFRSVAARLNYQHVKIPLISNLSGDTVAADEINADYWVRHVREAVRFSDSMQRVNDKGCQAFLEVGPSPTLLGMGAKCLPESAAVWLPSLRKGRADWQQMLESLATLYVHGVEANWKGFDRDYRRNPLVLPTYPFQRKRYWVELPSGQKPASAAADRPRKTIAHPLLGCRIDSPFVKDVVIESSIDSATHQWIKDHQVFGHPVLPATAFIEMALAAAEEAFGVHRVTITEMDIREAVLLDESKPKRIQIAMSPLEGGASSFQIASCTQVDGSAACQWKVNAGGTVRIAKHQISTQDSPSLQELKSRCQQEIEVAAYHQHFSELGMHLGPRFKGLQRLWKGEDEVLGEVSLVPEIAPEAQLYQIHPGMLDSCLQPFAALAFASEQSQSDDFIYMPVALQSYTNFGVPGDKLWTYVAPCHSQTEASGTLKYDILVFGSDGTLVSEIRGLAFRRVDRRTLEKSASADWRTEGCLYELSWKESPLLDGSRPAASVSMPSPLEIVGDLNSAIETGRIDPELDAFARLFPRLESVSTQYCLRALTQLGWIMRDHERFTSQSKAAELKIPAKYVRLFGRMLEMLHEDGILSRYGDSWEVRQLPSSRNEDISSADLLHEFPACSAELSMTARCGENLAKIIRGKCDPLDVLFPNGSAEDIEKLYRDSPFARFYNDLIENAIDSLLSRMPSDRPLRILEIGAGTGSTTGCVLPRLPAKRTEYVFTDISPLFLSRARATFHEFPFVTYRTLDIERDPLAQGFEPHSYDMVVAANVLHATEDLRRTLQNVRALLASEGVFLLLEGTRPLRFGDVIVGITEGWWKFRDTELRPSHALISGDKWKRLLSETGFADIVISPDGERDGVLRNQSLILSRAPRFSGWKADSHPSTPAGNWMVFSDGDRLGQQLETLLSQSGKCCTILRGHQYAESGDLSYQINPDSADDFRRLLLEAKSSMGSSIDGILYLWSLENRADEDLHAAIRNGCESLLNLLKALASDIGLKVQSFVIVTRGAYSITRDAERTELAQAPLSAIAGTIALEYPELHCARIDLDLDTENNEAFDVALELPLEDESLIAFRHGKRYVARLARVKSDELSSAAAPFHEDRISYRLQTASPGVLDGLAMRPFERRPPKAGEVEVAVVATGLNFRDVLLALGQYPGNSGEFGYECSGRVLAVGPGVREITVGQRVIVMGPGSFASHMTVPSASVMPVPECLSDCEAATIPSAFLTAYYALSHLGRISAGERVLIHAAAGGVGLAAVQLAQKAGAEVFATAGSEQKRAFLRSLGITHVMNSRSLDFADEVMRITRGRGVDVVLNSLAGEFIDKSFSVLAANGRFLEIGMTGIWSENRVAQLNRNISYFPINLAATFVEAPQLIAELMRDLLQQFEAGRLKPLPLTVFPIKQVTDAFRYMAQARHTGKIAVRFDGPAASPRRSDQRDMRLSPEATYMVTGGLAGLGLLVAKWMVSTGAQHIVLLGRSAPSEHARQVIRELEEKGARVIVAQGDLADRKYLDSVFSTFGQTLPPLRGIVHSAGALDDGVLLHQSWSRFEKVFAPKVMGSWHLHELTKELPLDFFVMFSSAVSLLGSAGQANHVAACAFEDALASYRRAQGLPAISINWGPWAETGAATRGTVSQRLPIKGFRPMDPERGIEIFQTLLDCDRVQTGAWLLDWRQYCDSLPVGFRSALLSELSHAPEVSPSMESAQQPVQRRSFVQEANEAPESQRRKLLLEFLRKQVVQILALDPNEPIDHKQPLSDLGLDSLMAVELRGVLSAQLELPGGLPATLAFDYPTIAALAEYLAKKLWADATVAGTETVPSAQSATDLLDRIETLSDEEVDQIFSGSKAVN